MSNRLWLRTTNYLGEMVLLREDLMNARAVRRLMRRVVVSKIDNNNPLISPVDV